MPTAPVSSLKEKFTAAVRTLDKSYELGCFATALAAQCAQDTIQKLEPSVTFSEWVISEECGKDKIHHLFADARVTVPKNGASFNIAFIVTIQRDDAAARRKGEVRSIFFTVSQGSKPGVGVSMKYTAAKANVSWADADTEERIHLILSKQLKSSEPPPPLPGNLSEILAFMGRPQP
ncbi:MAG: hypothetical protein EB059_06590 [Alphaproteobacteria bacterium]|nr:hypothetical protein [Alphaproteobacteria bacterium]